MEGLVGDMTKILAGFYKNKKVLVTGHTGFKGSWLVEWLLMLGARVTGLALPPPTEPALFDQLGLAGRCDHRIGDIRDRVLVRRIVHEVRPDLVFHLAAQPLVRLSYAQPLETFETNVMGTAHVLDALRDADWTCAAVMVTTDKVYENKESRHAYRESDPLGGYDPYSSSKGCAELVIQSYRQSFFNPAKGSIPPLIGVASARAGNVIGGGDWALDRIVPDCMRALARGEVIDVRNPNATRPWQHVLEPLGGYLQLGMRMHEALTGGAAMKQGDTSPASLMSLCSAFNFGPAPESTRCVREVVEEILKDWPGRWNERTDHRVLHEAGLLGLAIDKASSVLGWSPKWDFQETINKTVTWYKEVASKPEVAASLVDQQIQDYMNQCSPDGLTRGKWRTP